MGVLLQTLIKLRRFPVINRVSFYLLFLLFKIELPLQVKIGRNIIFLHGSTGLVVHPRTVIEDNVKIFHGVTLGRADSYNDFETSKFKGIVIREGAIICAGAKVLCKEGILTVGKNTVIGANSVLLKSTGDNEIWAGVPAKKIGNRQ